MSDKKEEMIIIKPEDIKLVQNPDGTVDVQITLPSLEVPSIAEGL
jgi:hypothetical protein